VQARNQAVANALERGQRQAGAPVINSRRLDCLGAYLIRILCIH
jgi:hypothetical protein